MQGFTYKEWCARCDVCYYHPVNVQLPVTVCGFLDMARTDSSCSARATSRAEGGGNAALPVTSAVSRIEGVSHILVVYTCRDALVLQERLATRMSPNSCLTYVANETFPRLPL